MPEINLKDPYYWTFQANANFESSSVMFEKLLELNNSQLDLHLKSNKRYAYINSYMMLLGYSLENLFKGALIKKFIQENYRIEEDSFNYFKKAIWHCKIGHEITQMSQSLLIDFTSTETELISRAEKYIKWAGRYFFPRKESDYEVVLQGGLGYKKSDLKNAENIFKKVKEKFELSDSSSNLFNTDVS